MYVIIPHCSQMITQLASWKGGRRSPVTPAGVSGISPLYSLYSWCPRFLAVEAEVSVDRV